MSICARSPSLYAALALRQPALVIDLERRKIALAGTGNRLRRQMVDLFELVTAGPADADRLTAEALRGRAHRPGSDATTVLAGISRTYRLEPHDGEGRQIGL